MNFYVLDLLCARQEDDIYVNSCLKFVQKFQVVSKKKNRPRNFKCGLGSDIEGWSPKEA